MRIIYRANQVFTPTSSAINTFVERASAINNHLVDALETPGRQIVIYGHSGCGKTTLIKNKLDQIYEGEVKTLCMEGMTFENILLDGFDNIGQFYSEVTTTSGFKVNPSVTLSYNEIKATLNLGELSSQTQTSNKNFIPPQLTPQRLAKFFGEARVCWVLEDFHKIKGNDKTKTSQLMKVFMDMSMDFPDLKIIAIGAVGTARQVVEYHSEMNNRVAEIFVPYMTPKEIESIINKGEKLLNLKFTTKVKDRIVKYSCGLPSICHHLCLNICFLKNIRETVNDYHPVVINSDDLEDSIQKYISEKSDTLKAEFDKAIKIGNNVKVNLPEEILRAALKCGREEFSFDDIFSKLKHLTPKGIGINKVEEMLAELCSAIRSEIFVYDANSNKYHFSNLFLKGYTVLQFEEEPEVKMTTDKNKREIDRLLQIIEQEILDSDDLDDLDDDAPY